MGWWLAHWGKIPISIFIDQATAYFLTIGIYKGVLYQNASEYADLKDAFKIEKKDIDVTADILYIMWMAWNRHSHWDSFTRKKNFLKGYDASIEEIKIKTNVSS